MPIKMSYFTNPFHRLVEYAEPVTPLHHDETASRFGRFFGHDAGQYPIEQKIEAKRRGTLVRQSRPYVCWILAVVMTAVIIYELVTNCEHSSLDCGAPLD